MKKKRKNAIIKWANKLSNEELEKECYSLIYDLSNHFSQVEEMYELGYDLRDIKERDEYEKFMNEKCNILCNLCDQRGIKLFET